MGFSEGPCLRVYNRIRPGVAWSMPEHAHAWHELILVMRGRYTVIHAGQHLPLRSGQAVQIPAGLAHATSGSQDPEICFVNYDLPPDEASLVRPLAVRRDELVQRCLLGIGNLHPGQTPQQRRRLAALLEVALYAFCEAAPDDDQRLQTQVRALIQQTSDQRITLDELAAAAGLNRFHFIRRFAAATGETPMRFVARTRAETAFSLLTQTDLPIKAVARRIGAPDPDGLRRLTRRFFRQPPAAIRRQAGIPFPPV